ncbi:MAG TPA: extensin family protein [Roseiarcus sp.]
MQAAFGVRRRASFGAAAAVLILAASGAAPATGKQAPNAHASPLAPTSGQPLLSTSAMDESAQAQCVSELASRKVVFEQLKEATREGCRLSAPVSLTSVATLFGDVSLPAKPTMLCSFGLKFSEWVRDVAAPLTLAYTGQKLAEIETGPGFACTSRYDKPGALPSEHAKGDAIDVVSFVLADKRRVTVKALGPLVGALRMTACGYFTTVLGPGADPEHETHLHLDILMHGGTSNYRICE